MNFWGLYVSLCSVLIWPKQSGRLDLKQHEFLGCVCIIVLSPDMAQSGRLDLKQHELLGFVCISSCSVLIWPRQSCRLDLNQHEFLGFACIIVLSPDRAQAERSAGLKTK